MTETNPFERAKARLDGGRAWGMGGMLKTHDCIEAACGLGWKATGRLSWEDRERGDEVLRSVLTEQYPEFVARDDDGRVIAWVWNDWLYNTEGPAAYPKVEAILDKCAQRWEESVGTPTPGGSSPREAQR